MYRLFTTEALKIFTDALHGEPPAKSKYWLDESQEVNFLQLIAFLSYDGQLSWQNERFPLFIKHIFKLISINHFEEKNQNSQFETAFMKFAVYWITEFDNHANPSEHTTKRFAIMIFYLVRLEQSFVYT